MLSVMLPDPPRKAIYEKGGEAAWGEGEGLGRMGRGCTYVHAT